VRNLMEALSLVRNTLQELTGEEDGATATEYAITAGFIAVVIVAGAGFFGLSLNGYFDHLTTGVKTALGFP